ncbi:MAG: heparin lyase I family protein, partial [Woeseiaceae bacterium]
MDMTCVFKGHFAAAVKALRLLVLVCAGLFWLATGNAAEVRWKGDFEAGLPSIAGTSGADFSKKLYDEGTNAEADVESLAGMGICGNPREGLFSGRTSVLEGGSGVRVRAEIKSHLPGTYKFDWDGPEYWIGISFCLAEWPKGSDAHTFLQLHSPNEESGSNCDFEGNALTIGVVNDTANIRVLDNPSGISEGGAAQANNKIVYTYNLRDTLGQWQDFVFRFHLNTKGNGYYTAWHNGRQVASESGLVNVNWKDSCGNVIAKSYHNGLHLGIYGGPNNAGPKTLYLDSAKIAEGSNGYDLVAPGGGSQVPRPN